MSNRVTRSIANPVRDRLGTSTNELWSGPDKGLILCWEKGREKGSQEPELAAKAARGELPELCWARGTPNYQAYWQGLRGEDLSVDREEVFEQQCVKTGRTFACGGDRVEREKRQLKLNDDLKKKEKKAAALQAEEASG